MRTIEVNPDLLQQYTQMTKNEILLHISLRSLAEGGKWKRNVRQFAKFIGTSEQRIRDAEYGLIRRGLLRVHLIRNRRWWYIYDPPVGEDMTEEALIPVPNAAPGVQAGNGEKKRRSLWRKIRDAFVGTRLDNFDLEEP